MVEKAREQANKGIAGVMEGHAEMDIAVSLLAFFAVVTWWLDRRSRLTPSQIDKVFRSLVLPTVRSVLG